MENSKTCSICQAPISANYCSSCGQKITNKKATFISIISDFFSTLFDFQRSSLATLIKIITQPKFVVTNYIKGNRNYYDSPSRVLFYALAIAGLHVAFIDNQYMLGGGSISLFGVNVPMQILMFTICIPILSLSSFLSFIRSKHSFIEHFISVLYLMSCFFIPVLILNDIQWAIIEESTIEDVSFFILLLLVFVWNAKVFTPKGKILKTIFQALLQIIIFSIIMVTLYWLIQLSPITFTIESE